MLVITYDLRFNSLQRPLVYLLSPGIANLCCFSDTDSPFCFISFARDNAYSTLKPLLVRNQEPTPSDSLKGNKYTVTYNWKYRRMHCHFISKDSLMCVMEIKLLRINKFIFMHPVNQEHIPWYWQSCTRDNNKWLFFHRNKYRS